MAQETYDFGALRRRLGVTFRDRTSRGRRGQPDGYPCALCGRTCPNPTRLVRFVCGHLDTVGTNAYADREENQPGDMGGYPIGSGCWRKVMRATTAQEQATFFIPLGDMQ